MSLLELDNERIDSFIRLARNMIRLEVLILCEGSDDIDTLKSLVEKLNIQLPNHVGISDCGGITKLRQFAPIVSTICRLSKRTRKIVLIIDVNTNTPQEKVTSLQQSLASHFVHIENLRRVSDSFYRATFERFEILILIVGNLDLSFKSHEMEDHAIHLLMLKGEIEESHILNFVKASDFIEEYGKKANQIIEESEETQVTEAYEDVINLLNEL